MKRHLLFWMLTAMTVLSACSKSDDVQSNLNEKELTATFNVQLASVPGSPSTKATVDGLTRYIVEAYEDADLSATPLRAESTTGTITIALKKNTNYAFLFWADKGEFNAESLKAVKPAESTISNKGTRAYCLSTTFNSANFEDNSSPVLKNAVASINFVNTGEDLCTPNNIIKVTYSDLGAFNVANGATIPNSTLTPVTRILEIDDATVTGVLATDYIFAARNSELIDIKVQLNSEPNKNLTNVPVQCNYVTNIKGEYTNLYMSEFIINTSVEDYTNNDSDINL